MNNDRDLIHALEDLTFAIVRTQGAFSAWGYHDRLSADARPLIDDLLEAIKDLSAGKPLSQFALRALLDRAKRIVTSEYDRVVVVAATQAIERMPGE